MIGKWYIYVVFRFSVHRQVGKTLGSVVFLKVE